MLRLKSFYFLGLLILILTACSQEAQPYEEVNSTISTSPEKGHIDTH